MAPTRLRQAREAAGLHIAALAAALKVPVRKLEALEAGRYSELPDLTFARALASSACRHLRIDANAVLDEIPHPEEPHLSQFPKAIGAPFRTPPSESAGGGNVGGGGLKKAVWLAVILLLAAGAVFLLPDPPPWSAWLSKDASPAAPARDGLVVDPVSSLSSATADAALPVEAQEPSGAVQETLPDAALPSAQISAEEAKPVEQPVAPAANAVLVLRAKGESWVEVVNARGGVSVQRLVRAGDVLDFSSAPPYSVVIGKADQVEVLVRGKPMDIAPMTRNSVARFEVK